MSGRWDPYSDTEGGVNLLRLDSTFTITEFFDYDESTNTTRFSAFTEDYRRNPGLRFDLLGALVPSPASAWMFGVGLLVAARRRR